MKTSQHFPQPAARGRRAMALLAFLALLLAGRHASAEYRVELDAPGALEDLLGTHLDLMRYRDRKDLNPDQLNFMVATAPDQVRKLAATEGYFSPRTEVTLDEASGVPVVRLKVDAGPRTRVSAVDVGVTGAAAAQSPEQAGEVRKNWPMRVGRPFRQEDWSAAKESGLRILQRRRYPTARIERSQAGIYPDRQAAELSVTYDSGPLFTLGEPNITGTRRYPERIISNVNPLRAGEEYSVDRLLEFQRAVQRTPYFSNVVVAIDDDPANAERAPVNVRVTEFPTQQVRGGVGYATDTGAHVEGRYSHYNVFGRAWVFDATTRLEQERQFGAVELAMPPSRGAYVNSVNGSIDRTTLEGVDLRSRRLGVRRSRSTDTDDYAYSIDYYRDELEQLSGAALPPDIVVEPGTNQALVVGYSRTRRRVDDPVFPRRGHIITAQAGVALEGLLTDQTFFRVYSRMRHYSPVGSRDLVLLRAELGAVITKGGNAAVPASLLFRAGGTESVRGYGFQSIGNVRNGTVYPTRYLATGGVEYQRWFRRDWGAAVFYDAGFATDDWSGRNLFHAVGVGARWRSPVGPVNIDVGYGFEDKRLRPHLSLGVAF